MEEVSEIYHKPSNGRQIQKLRVIASETSEKFHLYATKNAQFRNQRLSCNLEETRPFKCHTEGLMTPWSLLKQCTAFVAFHAEMLDSLEDFPDDIGHSIWMECCSNGKLAPEAQPSIRETIIQIFCQAYPGLMLPKCHVNSLNFLNNFELELNLLFSSVVQLNLSGLGLHDDHDLIRCLLKNSPNLCTLILSQNELTNKGLRNLFLASSREQGCRLKYIDVSCNPGVTSRGIVKYLCVVCSIDKIVVSVNLNEGDQSTFDKTMLTEGSFRRKTRPDLSSITESYGWAVNLLKIWESFLTQKSKANSRALNVKKSTFYGAKKIHEISNKKHEIWDEKSESQLLLANKIMFERFEAKIIKSDKRARIQPEISMNDEDNEFEELFRLYKKTTVMKITFSRNSF